MKYLLNLIFIVSFYSQVNAQYSKTDSLKLLLENTPNDTNRVKLLLRIGNQYYFFKPDTSIYYTKIALELSRNLHYVKGIINSLTLVGEASRLLGDYPASLKMQQEALELNKKTKDIFGEATSLCFTGVTYNDLKEYRRGLDYLLPANSIVQNFPINEIGVFILTNIGIAYNFLNNPDSALYYLRMAYDKLNYISHPQLKSYIPISIGNVYADLGNKDSALFYYNEALQNSLISNETINMSRVQQKLAELYDLNHQYDSSMFYARKAFEYGTRTNQKVFIQESSSLLVKLYRKANMLDSAFYYEEIAVSMKESLFGAEKFKQLQLLMLEKQQQQQKIEQDQERFRNKIKYIALLSVLGIFLLIAFILLRNNRHKQKTNILLQEQKNKIEHTLGELKATQSQLIQSEKMASLGELTAGIAHEIQNPLNFVNNFSELNQELANELDSELAIGNTQLAKDLVADIKTNSEKINQHGLRASSIVKGMLEHSRKSSGEKILTDINALCDEYLRLSYHGLRAKDKSFNAEFKTELDPNMPKINVVSQDIARVLLNIINNAFQACHDKNLLGLNPGDQDVNLVGLSNSQNEYKPLVSVKTKLLGDKIAISITDNGTGIPDSIKDKIFQPFFTTKPTGQGTGLGLSLSYDIIKAHGGTITVNSKYGMPGAEIKVLSQHSESPDISTEFIIQIPIR
jgi:signal transduction histidine kinase